MKDKNIASLAEIINNALEFTPDSINLTKKDIYELRKKLNEIEEQIEKQENLMYATVSYNPDLTEGRCYYSIITIPISFETDDEFRKEYMSENIAKAIENIVLNGSRKYETIMGSIQYMETVKSYVDTEKPNFETKLLDVLYFEDLPRSDYELEEYLKKYLKEQGVEY